MRHAAKLHPNFFWAKIMAEGADMIERLSTSGPHVADKATQKLYAERKDNENLR
jgi:hypothetical protein